MKAFAYVNPTNEKDAVAALKTDGIALPLAGGQDLLARMKDYIDAAGRIVNVKNALDATIAATPDGGMKIGAAVKIVDLAEHAQVRTAVSGRHRARPDRDRHAADPQPGHGRRQPQSAAALLVFPQRGVRLLQEGRHPLLRGARREPVPRDLRQRRPEPHRSPVEPGRAVRRVRREVPRRRSQRRARDSGGRILHAADAAERAEGERARRRGAVDARHPAGAGQREERALRSALQGVARLAAGVHHGRARR